MALFPLRGLPMGYNPSYAAPRHNLTGRKLGIRQRKIINAMLDNNGVWNPNWKLYRPDRDVMHVLLKRGIVEKCVMYNAVHLTGKTTNDELAVVPRSETFQITEKFKNGLVK